MATTSMPRQANGETTAHPDLVVRAAMLGARDLLRAALDQAEAGLPGAAARCPEARVVLAALDAALPGAAPSVPSARHRARSGPRLALVHALDRPVSLGAGLERPS